MSEIPPVQYTLPQGSYSITVSLPNKPDIQPQTVNAIIVADQVTILEFMFETPTPTTPIAQLSGIRVFDKSTGIWYSVYPEGQPAYCTPGTGNLVIAYGVNNVGDVDGTLYGKIIGPGEVILHSGSAWVPLGGAAAWEVTLDMIAQILNLTVEVGH